jgi:DNA primase
MSHQAGEENAVASSGTALTFEHLNIVKRYTSNLIFAFDTDLAGENATRRSIDLALANDFNVKVVQIGEKDPADVIKQKPEVWKKAVLSAVSFVEHLFENAFKKFKNENGFKAEEKKEIGKIILPVIKRLPGRIEQAHWIGELSKRLRIDEKVLYSEMQKIKLESLAPSFQKAAPVMEKKPRSRDLEERIISIGLNYHECLKECEEIEKNFFSDDLAEIWREMLSPKEGSEKIFEKIKEKLNPELSQLADFLILKGQQTPIENKEAPEEIKTCLRELKILKLKEAMAALNFEIKELQSQKNKEKLTGILEKFKKLSNQLIELTK